MQLGKEPLCGLPVARKFFPKVGRADRAGLPPRIAQRQSNIGVYAGLSRSGQDALDGAGAIASIVKETHAIQNAPLQDERVEADLPEPRHFAAPSVVGPSPMNNLKGQECPFKSVTGEQPFAG